jgi:fumarate reductase flavoprotein subunit
MDESGKTIDWLQFDHGFLFTKGMRGFGANAWLCKQQYVYKSNMVEGIDYAAENPNYTFGDRSSTVGQYYDSIISDFEALGGEYMLETTVTELIYDDDNNRVTGIKARSNIDGTEYTISAKAVVSATGGFCGSAAMQQKYLTNPYYPLQGNWNLWGMHQNKGQLIDSAIAQGAATYNIDMSPCIHFKTTADYLTEFPAYYRDGLEERMQEQNVWSLNDIPMLMGISGSCLQVGTDGKRHYNESGVFAFWAGGPVWYSIYGSDYVDKLATEGYPGSFGTYQPSTKVFGQGGYPNARPIPQIYEVLDTAISKGYVYKADTLEDLAAQIDVPVEDFTAQVERYESYCGSGEDEEFDKSKETLVSQINKAPYYAIKTNATPYSTVAALEIDTDINVLNSEGIKMGGLFACGNDSGGALYTNMLPYAGYGGVALGWAFTSGRLVGEKVVNYLASL